MSDVLNGVHQSLEAGDAAMMRRSIVTTHGERPAARRLISITEEVAAIRRLASARFGATRGLTLGIDILPPAWIGGQEVVQGDRGRLEVQLGRGFLFERIDGRWRLAYTRTIRHLSDRGGSRALLELLDWLAGVTSDVRARLERGDFASADALQSAIHRELGMRIDARINPDPAR